MQELIRTLRTDLAERYGPSASHVEGLMKRFLQLWDQSRQAFHSQGKAIIVMPVYDPAGQWSSYVLNSLILRELTDLVDESHSSLWARGGFVFSWIATPGADCSSVLRACAESMKQSSPREWAMATAIADLDYILPGCDSNELLERHLWAAIGMVKGLLTEQFDAEFFAGAEPASVTRVQWKSVDEASGLICKAEAIVPRKDHLPIFLVSNGENLTDAAIYQMQDIASRCECRFLVATSSADPDSFDCFGEGTIHEDAFDILPFTPAIANVENIVAAEMESGHFLLTIESWMESIRGDESTEGMSIPFSISTSIINLLEEHQS